MLESEWIFTPHVKEFPSRRSRDITFTRQKMCFVRSLWPWSTKIYSVHPWVLCANIEEIPLKASLTYPVHWNGTNGQRTRKNNASGMALVVGIKDLLFLLLLVSMTFKIAFKINFSAFIKVWKMTRKWGPAFVQFAFHRWDSPVRCFHNSTEISEEIIVFFLSFVYLFFYLASFKAPTPSWWNNVLLCFHIEPLLIISGECPEFSACLCFLVTLNKIPEIEKCFQIGLWSKSDKQRFLCCQRLHFLLHWHVDLHWSDSSDRILPWYTHLILSEWMQI